MSTTAGYSRAQASLGWLNGVLAAQRGKVMGLLARLGDLSALRNLNPRIFAKFVNMLEQISAAKAEETEVISEIEAIEQKHRFQRKSGSLKHFEADTAKLREAYDEDECERDCARPDRSWEAFIAQQTANNPNIISEIGAPCAPSVIPTVIAASVISTSSSMGGATPAAQNQSNGFLKLLAAWYLFTLATNSSSNQELTDG
jgi:hypothetical protein